MPPLLTRVSFFVPLLLLAACVSREPVAFAPEITAAVAATEAAGDDAARMRADIAWLADDAREGREAGTQGYAEAARYVAARLASLGLEPGADGSWFQEVPLISGSLIAETAAFSVTGPDGEAAALAYLDDFRVFPSLAAPSFDITKAEAVFVGYGVHAPAFGYDDYEDVDVEGKVVVYFSGAPEAFDTESRAHFASNGVKSKTASERGAIGAISLYTAATEKSYPWERFTANPSYSAMSWVGPDGKPDTDGENIKGRAALHPDKAALLFDGAPHAYAAARAAADGEGAPTGSFDLAVTVSMTGAMETERVASDNVVGLIPGADPDLKDEYVILTAHLDHIGVNESLIGEGKDGINNGAMDNAVGVAAMLQAAADFAAAGDAPARSVMIVAVTAEEKGLLGADYFAHFPTIGEGEMAANVNLDMPVILHDFTDVIAFGAERSSIGPVMKAALDAEGVTLSPDPIPELGIFTRSDHYAFVEQGVPSIFLWTGFENGGEEAFWNFYRTHYHQPSDDITQPIRYDALARFADVNYVIADALANTPERPRWNEGDFFGDLFGAE